MLTTVSGALRGNRKLALASVKQDGWALRDVAPALREDREIVMKAVRHAGDALQFASAELRGDREVVRAAMGSSPLSLEFAPEVIDDAANFLFFFLSGLGIGWVKSSFTLCWGLQLLEHGLR